MKTRLILDSALGQARSHVLRTVLADAAGKSGLKLVKDDPDAELWVLVGAGAGDATLSGKMAFQGTVVDAASDPDAFLQRARAQAAPHRASAAAPSSSVAAASSGPKRVVAVTACPTGVAHTFMAAEAIEAEAKKRGWWVKVETRGSVGAGNAITPEEVQEADLVIVAADIEVDLAKFAGKPMYRTSTGLALKKNRPNAG
ncbi:PTS system fructose-specific EIIB'BC component [Sodalis praecaptivus]|nr:PTS system fructose-specific EIIB'BC component [Sodalis praecaptivus]